VGWELPLARRGLCGQYVKSPTRVGRPDPIPEKAGVDPGKRPRLPIELGSITIERHSKGVMDVGWIRRFVHHALTLLPKPDRELSRTAA
jgi:hypothetical protein